ncbi:uncharacterized protein LY89DRAFT_719065 [Mollisia scopiformis]|uniref:Uncharacterized protein n=1 Tax=Mollisia scopiformis TaxID=149040 RepID=A0A194X828_MOLSC|nr:uncharacterized protein LY89DRAFT_719065 [Mollisia scopiformis]KUJ16320.1 hypothetical protein LY89DRAFT_719065 [Mollisia scopiformis]
MELDDKLKHGPGPDPTLTKCRLRTYHPAASTFLDLVDDPTGHEWQGAQRFKLRAGTRKASTKLIQEPSDLRAALQEIHSVPPITDWPAAQYVNDTDQQLDAIYQLMNPPSHLGNVELWNNDRTTLWEGGAHGSDAPLTHISRRKRLDIALESMKNRRLRSRSQLKPNRFYEDRITIPQGAKHAQKRTYSKATDFKRKAIQLLIKGKICSARPDTGSDRNIITEAFAKEHNIKIQQREEDKDVFVVGNGQYTRSVGKALVSCALFGGSESEQSLWFHVMAKCSAPIIMGREFLRKIRLYTENTHLLVD